ncbi:hypothetical protein GGI35DRAFT_362828 [Trichoderma velutinum]
MRRGRYHLMVYLSRLHLLTFFFIFTHTLFNYLFSSETCKKRAGSVHRWDRETNKTRQDKTREWYPRVCGRK